ncbi:MAG: efflux RND transporter periplasmic adaptor subunit [Pseudomonadales bacterium]|jgi:macrolide-specific efflux system membrane fusion protein|nr:efflux RND transporter periplasmic adaptor subunit [Pseudomonadales bacterium]
MKDFSSSRRKRILMSSFLLLLVLAGGYWYWQSSAQTQAEDAPLLAKVTRGSIENTIAAAGTLKPSRYVDVGAQVSGQLEKLYVEVGDVVEQGQLLAEIDARVQIAKVDASRASIEGQEAQIDSRRASLELARANAARQERLMNDKATSQLEYDNAVNNLASAESSLVQLEKQIEQSKATLTSDETQLGYTKIYAPSAGTVVSINLLEGVTLNASQQAPTVMRIADLSLMTVEAGISEADIGSIQKGMEVYFTTLGGGTRRWFGTVRQILPTPVVTNNVVLYTGLFDTENEDGSLFPEMTAQVYFVTSAARDVLTVPLGAIKFSPPPAGGGAARQGPPGGAAGNPGGGLVLRGPGPGGELPPGAVARRPAEVTVVKADGSREQRQVLVGVTSRISAEVVSGLQEGEEVVAGVVQAESSASAQPQQQQQFNNRGGGGGGGGFNIRVR